MASAISSADREPAPSSSIAAVRLATPNLPGGSSARAAEDDEVDLRDRHLVQLDDPDRQAVGELPLLNRRQLQRRRRAGLRRTACDRAPAARRASTRRSTPPTTASHESTKRTK